MKSFLKLLIATFIVVGLVACGGGGGGGGGTTTAPDPTPEEPETPVTPTPVPTKGSVQFSATIVNEDANNNLLLSTTTNKTPAKVLLKYQLSGDSSTETEKSFALTSLANDAGYITDGTLDLEAGAYQITEFHILNSGDTIIYTTPATGSDKAIDLGITTSLPYSFSVTASQTSSVEMEVVEVKESDTPEDFGHSEFTFVEVLFNIFYVDVLALDLTSTGSTFWSRTSATLTVKDTDGNTILNEKSLSATMNTIMVRKSANYTLTFSKDGYTPQSLTCTEAELQSYNTKPLVVKLK